jgi:hypothetical protein
VVVDLGSLPRWPDENLQGVGAVFALAAMGHVPIIGLSDLIQKGKDVLAQEGSILGQSDQEGNGFP